MTGAAVAVAKANKHLRFKTGAGKGHKPPVLKSDHPAVVTGRTLFPSTRRRKMTGQPLLKSGANNRKIGGLVTKGPWSGMPIFTLTLEERATCPRSCLQWKSCYGNHMHMAQRIAHGPAMERRLKAELERLSRWHPQGFVVRLHVLGDFYSMAYCEFWAAMLWLYPELRIFGYTAHQPGTPIGDYLAALRDQSWDRFAIRTSGGPEGSVRALVGEAGEGQIACPAQTSKTESCGTCALCWGTKRDIVFREH